MKGVKNLKVLGASLCLSAILLTGCGEDRIQVGKSDIVLEDGKTTGNISYEDVDTNLRIVSFMQESLNIVEEKPITPYLLSENFIQKEYTVEEILNFFNDKVLPSLENNSKELVK